MSSHFYGPGHAEDPGDFITEPTTTAFEQAHPELYETQTEEVVLPDAVPSAFKRFMSKVLH